MAEARSDEAPAEMIRAAKAYLCVDCGKCTATCPVGRARSIYSPRALVQHLMLDGRKPLASEIWRCLTCGLCRQRCPSDVDFPGFIRSLRAGARASGLSPQFTHGGTLREVMHIVACPEVRQSKMAWLPSWVRTIRHDENQPSEDGARDRAEDIYFVGCSPYLDVVFDGFGLDLVGTHIAGLELLRSCGVAPAVLADERCCGHDALWSGDLDLFARLGRLNLDLFQRAGARRIFVSCPEGYHTLKVEYPRYFGATGVEVVNTIVFLADSLKASTQADAGGLATYHDCCRMGRFSGLYDEPRNLLAKTRSAGMVEMESRREDSLCCGSNLWVNCDEISKNMQVALIKEALGTGAQTLLTACDKCRIHLACAQMELGRTTGALETDNILRFLYRRGVRT